MSELTDRLGTIAKAPILLVACDFDGTLAPIVDEPSLVQIDSRAFSALQRLASLRQTYVCIISGRARGDLSVRAAWPADVRLVGSHGLERSAAFASRMSPSAIALREQIAREMRVCADSDPGFHIEEKPASVAFHYRKAPAAKAQQVLEQLREGIGRRDGVFAREGLKVLEFSVMPGHKGLALNAVKHETGASAVLFLGDDLTDEDAFASLAESDVGVKVGEEETRAEYRVETTLAVAGTLAYMAERREAWLAGERWAPIERHSMLSDQRTIAIIDPEGRVVWMCLPRIDSAAVFAELLGGASCGYFDIRPVGADSAPKQEYTDGTLTLRTQWPRMSVTDYLDCSEGRPFQRAGRTDLVRVIEGSGTAAIRFAPRLNFGRTSTRLQLRDVGVEVEGTPEPIVLHSPGVMWRLVDEGPHQVAVAEVNLDGSAVVLDLRYGTGNLRTLRNTEATRRAQTENHWRAWTQSLSFPSIRPDLVKQSALVLRALCYRPSGAIAAAGTMGLPEYPGGVRNWDYRFCWPRDAALACRALVRLGSTGQALRFLDWLMGVLERSDSAHSLRPIYTVSGGHLGAEADLPELQGYAHSRPVRVGNAAAEQVQLDVFGPITDLIASLAHCEAPITPEHWRLTETMVEAVERRWRQPDHGIWELRLPPRQHVYSKVMCWQTVDRAQQIAETYLGKPREKWEALRKEIAQDVLEHGYKPHVGAFTAAYEEDGIDAATLHVGLSGLIPSYDERFVSTVRAVEGQLLDRSIVYRYRHDDGLPGSEGGFHLCTSWLIEAYLLTGRVRDARTLFDVMASCAGPTGLLSEEWDPKWRMALGNFPQAYSHLGLINAAVMLDAAERGTAIAKSGSVFKAATS